MKQVAMVFDGTHVRVFPVLVEGNELGRNQTVFRCGEMLGKGTESIVDAIAVAGNFLAKEDVA